MNNLRLESPFFTCFLVHWTIAITTFTHKPMATTILHKVGLHFDHSMQWTKFEFLANYTDAIKIKLYITFLATIQTLCASVFFLYIAKSS